VDAASSYSYSPGRVRRERAKDRADPQPPIRAGDGGLYSRHDGREHTNDGRCVDPNSDVSIPTQLRYISSPTRIPGTQYTTISNPQRCDGDGVLRTSTIQSDICAFGVRRESASEKTHIKRGTKDGRRYGNENNVIEYDSIVKWQGIDAHSFTDNRSPYLGNYHA